MAMYGVIRFLLGAAFVGMSSTVTLKMEMFYAKRRFIAASCDFGWTAGSLLLPVVVHLLPDWR